MDGDDVSVASASELRVFEYPRGSDTSGTRNPEPDLIPNIAQSCYAEKY